MEVIKNMLRRNAPHHKMEPPNKTLPLTPLSPFKTRISGSVRIEGPVKQEWIKDILKRIALIIACQIGSSDPNWELTTPYLFVAFRALFSRNLVYNSLKDANVTSRIATQIDDKFLSLLSHIPTSSKPHMEIVSHKWEFETPAKRKILFVYSIECTLEPYDYTLYDQVLYSGFKPFPDIDLEHESICDYMFMKCSERPIDPDHALMVLTPQVSRLKKLLLSHTRPVSVFKHNLTHSHFPSAPPCESNLP
nr:putative matrix protein [Lasius neglectus virus 2]